MIKAEYETKSYIKKEKVMVSEKRYCDVCNKEITGHHWQVTTGHNDWGSDSCESIEHYDVCSPLCLWSSILNDYIDRSNNSTNTEYISIEHLMWSDVKGEIKYEEIKP